MALRLRRSLFFGLTFATAAGATALMVDALQVRGLTTSELLGLVLSTACSPDCRRLWTAIAGFVIRIAGKDPAALDPAPVSDCATPPHGDRHACV